MALKGLNTLRTLRIFTTEMALDLQRDMRTVKECLSFSEKPHHFVLFT